jgi:hypothetical protein
VEILYSSWEGKLLVLISFGFEELYSQEMGVVKGKMAKFRDRLMAVVSCL